MSCRRFRKSLVEYADGRLDGPRLRKVEEHLSTCEGCGRAVDLLGLSRKALSSLDVVEIPDDASERVIAGLRAGGDRGEKVRKPRRGFDVLLSPRGLAAAGAALAVMICAVVLVVSYTGPTAPEKDAKPLANVTEEATRAPSGEDLKHSVPPAGAVSIAPVVRVSQNNYSEDSLRTAFDTLEIKERIADTCTMGHAISMGKTFRRKMADMMENAGSDGAMLEAMITYLTNSEPVLLPYYAENALFTGQSAFIIGLAGPRRMGETTNLNRTEVWVMSPARFSNSPDSSIIFFLEVREE